MKRLFILGASILQLPAIKRAKEMGLYVGVADYNPNAVAIPFADEYYNVSTIDEEGVYKAAKKFKADGITTIATDMPMRSVAYACKKLGLVSISYDTAVKSTDKGEMIKAFEEAGVAHPWYYLIENTTQLDEIIDNITFPCITKPTDKAGSRGVTVAYNRNELVDALKYSSENGRSGCVILEEYMRGPEVSVEVVVYQGEIHVLQITDKLTTGAPHFVELGHSQPSMLGDDTQEKIRKLAKDAVKAVGIQNGPAHVEIIVTEQGPKMVELGARMGGDCITTHLIPLSTGIDMIGATIDISLGRRPDLNQQFDKGAAIRFITSEWGVIKHINGLEEAEAVPGIAKVILTKNIGDQVEKIKSSTDRVGFVIAQKSTPQQAIECCVQALGKLGVEISKQKKMMFLGGFPQMVDIVETAKEMGIYTIVVDRDLDSPAKRVADKAYQISTDCIDELEKVAREEQVDGVFNGFEDFNIHSACELCKRLNLLFYGTQEQIEMITNKLAFKECCRKNSVPVVEQFSLEDAVEQARYPYIVKPADSYGSRGITVCRTYDELVAGVQRARDVSPSERVVIERYIDNDHGVELFYTIVDGHIHLTVTADRYTSYGHDGSVPLPVAEVFPSSHKETIHARLDGNIRTMLADMKIKNGLVLVQALYDGKDDFYVYEMAFRFTGEQHYLIFEKQNGVSLAQMMLKLALGESISEYDTELLDDSNFTKPAINLSVVISDGKIGEIQGVEQVSEQEETITIMLAHEKGDTIEKTVDYSHILFRVNMVAGDYEGLCSAVRYVNECVSVVSEKGRNMVVTAFELPGGME